MTASDPVAAPLEANDPQRARALKAKIRDRVSDVRRHLLALRTAMAEFGDDFELAAFRTAHASEDPVELNRVKAVERGVDQLYNYVAELAAFGLELAELRGRRDETNARRDLDALRDAGVISGELTRRLQRLRELRRMLVHEYATATAEQVHESALIVTGNFPADEVDRLLHRAPSVFEEAFWLCGAHAGLRLPGEALGLRWGAVDFQTGVMRPYDNWVRNEMDTTKTSDSEAIPMTPRLTRVLAQLRRRDYAIGEQDFVFVSELTRDSPVSERPLREAFKVAVEAAGLKPIRMYNLRHSFGTTLARNGIDIRTVQALMRHDRLSTTEQYMAYSPRPDLAEQMARALDPHSQHADVVPMRPAPPIAGAKFFERLEDEIPAKWLREVQRLYAEM